MPDSKPAAVDVFYKLRNDPIHSLKRGLRLDDPEQDSDQITVGVQNEGEFEVPFDKNNEKYDVFFRSYNVHGEGEPIGIKKELFRVNIDQAGGLSRSALSFVISDPGDNSAFVPDDVIQIEDEFLVVSNYDNLTRMLTVEERGAHASSPDSYANNTSVILCRYTVPHKSIVMVGDMRELGPPQITLVPVLGGFLIVAAAPADPDNVLDAYIIFRSDSSPASLQRDVIKVRAGQATHTFLHLLMVSDNRTIPWYIRVKSVTRSGIIGSAFSNEVSGKPLLSDEEAEAGEPSAPNMEVLADGGGVGEQDFRFLYGIELSDNLNTAGIVGTQLQVAGPSALHSPNLGFSAVKINETVARKPPFAAYITVTESSAEIGGAYQFSARMFNRYADIWGDWSSPVSTFTQPGVPDTGLPDEPREFSLLDVIDAGDVSGNRFSFTIKEPTLNSRTIWQYEIQGSGPVFEVLGNAGIEDNTGLSGVQLTGTGSVALGGSTLTVVTGGAGAFAEDELDGKIIYVHEGMSTESGTNNFTGEIIFPQSFVIAGNTVDVNGNLLTLSLKYGAKFRLNGNPGSGTRVINWIVADDWQKADTLIGRSFRVWSLVASGAPDSQRFQGEISSEPTKYWRVRAWNRPGAGRWIYHNSLLGTTQVSSAVAFQTSDPALGDSTVSKGFQAQVTSNVRFSAVDNNTVNWTSGTIYYPDSDSESVNSGSVNLANNQTYWVYKTVGASNRVLTATVNPAEVLGSNRVLVAQIATTGDANELASIVTPWMLGSTFTSAAINVNRLSAITGNIGSINAGSITGVTITASLFRTASSGRRVEISAGTPFINFHRSSGGAVYASIASQNADDGTLDIQPEDDNSGHFQSGTVSNRWNKISLNAREINIDAVGGEVHIDGSIFMNLAAEGRQFAVPVGSLASRGGVLVFSSERNSNGIAMQITADGAGVIRTLHAGTATSKALEFYTNNNEKRGFIHRFGGWFIGSFDSYNTIGNVTGAGPGRLTVEDEIYKVGTDPNGVTTFSQYNNPDFVLEHWVHGFSNQKPTYTGLMTLGEMESFLRRERHLPAIDNKKPSGIFERGDWVLESMESAYLYILQLHKRIAKLENAAPLMFD